MPVLKRKIPVSSVAIGIVAGGILGAVLAKGVLSIVYWRRDVNRQAEVEAEAAKEAQLRKWVDNSEWRRWSTQPGKQ